MDTDTSLQMRCAIVYLGVGPAMTHFIGTQYEERDGKPADARAIEIVIGLRHKNLSFHRLCIVPYVMTGIITP